MTGADLIAAERQRQVTDEGYDAAHDAGHADDLAMAAVTYATPNEARIFPAHAPSNDEGFIQPNGWPWDVDYWKPTPDDRVRELVKAGALIAAAIDATIR